MSFDPIEISIEMTTSTDEDLTTFCNALADDFLKVAPSGWFPKKLLEYITSLPVDTSTKTHQVEPIKSQDLQDRLPFAYHFLINKGTGSSKNWCSHLEYPIDNSPIKLVPRKLFPRKQLSRWRPTRNIIFPDLFMNRKKIPFCFSGLKRLFIPIHSIPNLPRACADTTLPNRSGFQFWYYFGKKLRHSWIILS